MVTDAQRKLEALVASRARRMRHAGWCAAARGWLAAATTAAVAAVALLWLPFGADARAGFRAGAASTSATSARCASMSSSA